MKKQENWDIFIKPRTGWLDINIKELFKYKDLIYLFVKRDFVTFYKQTILGPIWYVIQPLINTIVFTIIFGKLAKISTDGIPPFIFYMAGTVVWSYFATCISLTSNTFNTNADIFGKVYFPRIAVPIANVIISLLQFLIQFIIFIIFLFYFKGQGSLINPNINVFLLPLIILQMAILGLGFGILISSLTTKYKDLVFVMSFFVQLWMYATPIVYPLSIIPEKYRLLAAINPMTSVVETFRGAFLGVSTITANHIIVSVAVTICIFLIGFLLFHRIEKSFMDTV